MNEKQLINNAVSFYMKRFGEEVDPIEALSYYVREGQVSGPDRSKVNEIFHKEGLVDGGHKTIAEREKEIEKELYEITHRVYTAKPRAVNKVKDKLDQFRLKYGKYKAFKVVQLKKKTKVIPLKIIPRKNKKRLISKLESPIISKLNNLIKIATVRLKEAEVYIKKVEEGLKHG